MGLFDQFPIYWINMDHHKERRIFMELQLGGTDNTRVPGIYGKTINKRVMDGYIRRSKRNAFDDSRMNEGEIGCLLSHIKVYEESFKRDDDYIIVVEDDANIVDLMTPSTVGFLMENYRRHECIKLCIILPSHTELPKDRKPILMDWNEGVKAHYPWGFTWSTACYIISRSAREKIVKIFRHDKEELRPADFFLYQSVDTQVLFPPLVCNNLAFGTSIQDGQMDYHALSYHRIRDHYFQKKLVLIAVWFGPLPAYFDLWVYTLAGKNYGVLLVTDQRVPDMPDNIRHLFMTWEDFNNLLRKETGFDVALASAAKLVDAKPLLGIMFRYFIYGYEYWGWTDIDMMMGDISGVLETNPGYDVYSNGNASFGPLMFFKSSCTDVYRSIENYEKILNDPYVCKVDEPWWFVQNHNTEDGALYNDEGSTVRYYAGGTILDFVEQKKTYIVPWESMCTGIDWDIRDTLKDKKRRSWMYRITDKRLFKDNREINHCHLTLLKRDPRFFSFIAQNRLKNKPFSFMVVFTPRPTDECMDGLTTYEVYEKFVSISLKRHLL